MIMDEKHNDQIDQFQIRDVKSANIPELKKEHFTTLPLKVKSPEGETGEEGIKGYWVDGEVVRDKFNPDFIGGGHWLVYPFIPKNEFWVERMLSKTDQEKNMWHEIFEIRDMVEQHKDYEDAHIEATEFEQGLRIEDDEKKSASSVGRLVRATSYLSYVLAKKKKKKKSKKPVKVTEIADALRRDNPKMSDEDAYKIAWSNYCKNINPSYKGCSK